MPGGCHGTLGQTKFCDTVVLGGAHVKATLSATGDYVIVISELQNDAPLGYTLKVRSALPSRLGRVIPGRGGDTGRVTVTLTTENFLIQEGITVKLTRNGHTDITGEVIDVDPASSAVVVAFDLRDQPRGAWDVILSNPAGFSVTKADGFLIEKGAAPDIWTDVTGRSAIRVDREQLFSISYGNRGNTDAGDVIVLASFPKYVTWRTATSTVLLGNYATAAYTTLAFRVGVIGAGSTSALSLYLKVPSTAPAVPFKVRAWWVPQDLVATRDLLRPTVAPAPRVGLAGGLPNERQRLVVADSQNGQSEAPINCAAEVLNIFFAPEAYREEVIGACPRDTLSERCVTCFKEQEGSLYWRLFNSLGYTTAAQHLFEFLYGSGKVVKHEPESPAASTMKTNSLFNAWQGSKRPAIREVLLSIARHLPPDTKEARVITVGEFEKVEDLYPEELKTPLVILGSHEDRVAERDIGFAFGTFDKIKIVFLGDVFKETEAKGCQKVGFGPGILKYTMQDEYVFPIEGRRPYDYEGGYLTKFGRAKPFHVVLELDLPSEGFESSCEPPPPPCSECESEHDVTPVASLDPNAKVGVTGVGPARWVRRTEALRYTIFFENVETATAPAQEVVITDRLDPEQVDLETVGFGSVRFGVREISVVPGAGSVATEVDLRPAKNLVIRVSSQMNKESGEISWRFSSIDPGTRLPPDDPLAGFLPPNKVPPEGEGSVTFIVMPRAHIGTGSQFRNEANITFDSAGPITTSPPWGNTVDADRPQSRVDSIVEVKGEGLQVRWSGDDTGSGLLDYTVFVAENDGPFTVWRNATDKTSGTFVGTCGRTYRFYSIARDAVGNVEEAPTSPDAAATLPVCGEPAERFAVIGLAGISGGENVVIGGDIAANASAAIGKSARINGSVFANAVRLSEDARVEGEVRANVITVAKNAVIVGPQSPVALPVVGELGSVQVSSGVERVIVAKRGTRHLLPGNYLSIEAGESTEIRFAGGQYDVGEMRIGKRTRLIFEGATTINVLTRLEVGENVVFGGSGGLSASDIRVNYAGSADAVFGKNVQGTLTMLAPNALIRLGERSVYVGQFRAQKLSIGKGVRIESGQ